jgi:hypothetical protein
MEVRARTFEPLGRRAEGGTDFVHSNQADHVRRVRVDHLTAFLTDEHFAHARILSWRCVIVQHATRPPVGTGGRGGASGSGGCRLETACHVHANIEHGVGGEQLEGVLSIVRLDELTYLIDVQNGCASHAVRRVEEDYEKLVEVERLEDREPAFASVAGADDPVGAEYSSGVVDLGFRASV